MLVPVLLFILGLLLLIKGGDWFVDGSVSLAHRLRVPEILIGATVVSIGTTLPEVMVSATSAATGHGEIAYGNAIGSIICNTALIAALTMAIRPSAVDTRALKKPVIFFFASAVFYAAIAYTSGYFGRITGIVLLCIFAAYMVITVNDAFRHKEEEKPDEDVSSELPTWKTVLFLVIGAVCIAVGARLLVDNGTKIAEALHVPESVIALTFVALGTSLPELITAITALIKKRSALSVGNIIGANLFNLVLVSGVATTISPFKIPAEKLIGTANASLAVDIPLMFIVMAIMIFPTMKKGKLLRWQGITLLSIYAAFCIFEFVL